MKKLVAKRGGTVHWSDQATSSAEMPPYVNLHLICTALSRTSHAMGTDKRRRAVDSKLTMQPKAKDDSVRMTAKALIATTEPGRAHAVDLVLLGHLLASRLKRDGSVDPEWEFARVWRDFVVPVAAANMSDDWKVGM